jgi:hypothetical protein
VALTTIDPDVLEWLKIATRWLQQVVKFEQLPGTVFGKEPVTSELKMGLFLVGEGKRLVLKKTT